MLIKGYTVDKNLPAFRKAFFLPDILSRLDEQFPIWKWTGDMRDLPHLPQDTKERLTKAHNAMKDYFGGSNSDWKIDHPSYFVHNSKLQNQLIKWQKMITTESKAKYQCVSYIILELMEIAEYTATEQDVSTFQTYLQRHGYFLTQVLEIKLRDGKNPKLYYGGQIVTDLPDAKKYSAKGFATVAENPFTGYLGITKDGKLVNCSSFVVPTLKKRPVKVLLNQMCYVILQEDGSVIHNLRFSKEIPSVLVRDVILDKDQIQWTPM